MSILKDAWENKEQIAEGLKNRIFKTEEIEALRLERKSICEGCEWYSENLKDKEYLELSVEIRDHRERYELEISKKLPNTHCFNCFCDSETKLRAPDAHCPLRPIHKWDAVEIKE